MMSGWLLTISRSRVRCGRWGASVLSPDFGVVLIEGVVAWPSERTQGGIKYRTCPDGFASLERFSTENRLL